MSVGSEANHGLGQREWEWNWIGCNWWVNGVDPFSLLSLLSLCSDLILPNWERSLVFQQKKRNCWVWRVVVAWVQLWLNLDQKRWGGADRHVAQCIHFNLSMWLVKNDREREQACGFLLVPRDQTQVTTVLFRPFDTDHSIEEPVATFFFPFFFFHFLQRQKSRCPHGKMTPMIQVCASHLTDMPKETGLDGKRCVSYYTDESMEKKTANSLRWRWTPRSTSEGGISRSTLVTRFFSLFLLFPHLLFFLFSFFSPFFLVSSSLYNFELFEIDSSESLFFSDPHQH